MCHGVAHQKGFSWSWHLPAFLMCKFCGLLLPPMNAYPPVQPGFIILVIFALRPSHPSVPAGSLPDSSRADATPACLSLGLSLPRCWPAGEGSGGSSRRLPIPGSLAPPGLDSHRPRAHSPPQLSRSSWWLGWSAHLATGSLQERSCMFAFWLLLLLGLH